MMPKYLFCDDCEREIKEGQDYWEVNDDKLCEDCCDSYFEEMKRNNRKTNEQDIDNEVDEILMKRGE
ncbi:MAG TPA: hypothetical protein GX708_08115 [Gallicola sp.]|nr:hypothetical protein [Gallicola sp.]